MGNYDPTDLRGQERAKSDKDKRAQLIEETEAADIKWLMGSRRGRRILWRLLDQAGVFRLSFSTNAAAMAFAEGNRNAGLRILTLIHTHCPELYPRMIEESKDVRRTDNDDAGRTDH